MYDRRDGSMYAERWPMTASDGGASAVDGDERAGDVTRTVAGEEQCRFCNVLRAADTRQGNSVRDRVEVLPERGLDGLAPCRARRESKDCICDSSRAHPCEESRALSGNVPHGRWHIPS